jgi:hypothetical protein
MSPGLNVAKKDLPVDLRIAYLTGDKMKVPGRAIAKMIKENEHNKYTTTYYLFKQKFDKGELNLGKYENMTTFEDSTNIMETQSRRKLRDAKDCDSRISKELKRKYLGSNRIDMSKSKSRSKSAGSKSRKRRKRINKLKKNGYLKPKYSHNESVISGGNDDVDDG